MLKLRNLNKSYAGFSINSISLDVLKGEYFILLGPSGAGKSIVLEVIAGLTMPDSGTVKLNGIEITAVKMQERKVGLVFQDLALFPHLSVRQNIGYSFLRKGLSRREVHRKVVELANSLGIKHLLRRYPPTLSGGEQQRVALARTLALQPDILLLDEPLSSLDVERKGEIRKLLRDINRNGQTIVHVTHDYEEAIALGQKIAVINNGSIEQVGAPQDVFSNPASTFVAGFGGIRNFFRSSILVAKGNQLSEAKLNHNLKISLYTDFEGDGYITFPENAVTISNTQSNSSALNTFTGQVVDLYPQRHGVELVVDIGVKVYALVTQESVRNLGLDLGKSVWVSFKASSVRFIAKG
jgi:molybdopterin-binding protein